MGDARRILEEYLRFSKKTKELLGEFSRNSEPDMEHRQISPEWHRAYVQNGNVPAGT